MRIHPKLILLLWLTLFEFSGTFRAAKYASMYPNRVGRFVFDAVVPHGRVNTALCFYQLSKY